MLISDKSVTLYELTLTNSVEKKPSLSIGSPSGSRSSSGHLHNHDTKLLNERFSAKAMPNDKILNASLKEPHLLFN